MVKLTPDSHRLLQSESSIWLLNFYSLHQEKKGRLQTNKNGHNISSRNLFRLCPIFFYVKDFLCDRNVCKDMPRCRVIPVRVKSRLTGFARQNQINQICMTKAVDPVRKDSGLTGFVRQVWINRYLGRLKSAGPSANVTQQNGKPFIRFLSTNVFPKIC